MHRRTVVPTVVLVATVLFGCGSEGSDTETVTVQAPVEAPSSSASPKTTRVAPIEKRAPADSEVGDGFVHCDANIEAKQPTTTCGFAQNVFWHYWTNDESGTLHVYSPATKTTFATDCVVHADVVICTTNDGGEVRFARSAIASYSQDQADTYASEHDLGPDPYESDSPTDEDRESNDDDVDVPAYSGSSPPAGTSSGENIPNYENGNGYRVQCADGMYSQSGGIQGACSGHGGVSP